MRTEHTTEETHERRSQYRYEMHVTDANGVDWFYDRISKYMPAFDPDLEGLNIGILYSRRSALKARSAIQREHPGVKVLVLRDPNGFDSDPPDLDAYKLDADGVLVLRRTRQASKTKGRLRRKH